MANDGIRPGVYNVDYYSGSQVAVYIGDVWVDDVTSIQFQAMQTRRPLFGYADELFRAVSKGQLHIQGQFTINFKEAGYLWLILQRYQKFQKGSNPFIDKEALATGILAGGDLSSYSDIRTYNIEQLINGDTTHSNRFKAFETLQESYASLGGFSSSARAGGDIGKAENEFEIFEDKVWKNTQEQLDNLNRRADDTDLNPFDIFLSFGDFQGDNRVNHTIIKLSDVYITGSGQAIEVDGMPLQESYSFLCRNRV